MLASNIFKNAANLCCYLKCGGHNKHGDHKRDLANNTGETGGGGAKLAMGIRKFILQRSQT